MTEVTEPTKPRLMLCMAEWGRPQMRLFEPVDGQLVCTDCGWCQATVASGAYELVMCATWHDMDAYRRMCRLARSGGYQAPDQPPYWED